MRVGVWGETPDTSLTDGGGGKLRGRRKDERGRRREEGGRSEGGRRAGIANFKAMWKLEVEGGRWQCITPGEESKESE